jgi:hypothetical protein
MKKRFVLAIVEDFRIYECMIDELISMGFDVDLFIAYSRMNVSACDKQINSLLKRLSVKKYDDRKLALKNKFEEGLISRIGTYDYGLVIRPDAFGQCFLDCLSKQTKMLIAYQWDGMKRFTGAADTIAYFDNFFVYEDGDVKQYPGTVKAENFYFGNVLNEYIENEKKYDAYYLGSYDERINQVIDLCEDLVERGLSLNIKIPCSSRDRKKLKNFSYIDTRKVFFTYRENLRMASRSRIILDFGHEKLHEGLSFRPFEALGFGVKCITTNPIIKEQKFYNERNFHYYTRKSDVDSFLQSPFVEDHAAMNYSFSSWLDRKLTVRNGV